MKVVNTIQITVFAKAQENKEQIVNTLKEFLPGDLEKEKVCIEETKAIGSDDSPVVIYKVLLSKDRHCNDILHLFKEKLPADQKQLLVRQLHSRLDEEFDFFLRLDKDALLNDHRYELTDGGHCFHFKLNIACFPRKRATAEKVIREMFV